MIYLRLNQTAQR